ncbi:MAG: FG-GAP-like repeat-containing protein [Bacteroidota bacterium]|nr:FG-GAP-like repeat-containing protein [Bacteroidota bacterium]
MVFIWLFIVGVDTLIIAQVKFIEIQSEHRFNSGIITAIADMNGDDVDDLIVVDQAKKLWLGLNSGKAYFFWEELPFESNVTLWSLAVADLDRNGYNDIAVSGHGDGVWVLYQDELGFRTELLAKSKFFPQALTLCDINVDGYVDLTVCDDNAQAKIYLNDRKGLLIQDTTFIDLSLPETLREAGNYGCMWSDFDMDGDLELYLSRCRGGVTDPEDWRRRNLFYTRENGNFVERGAAYNIAIKDQSWCSASGDLNGDGLPDLVVLNHYSPSIVLKQKHDHTFEDVTIASGLNFPGIPIQLALEDFDLDGNLDILISGTTIELWLNDGNMKFTKSILDIGERSFSSFSVGDFNMDGFPDIYSSYANLLNVANNQRDRIWLHVKNANHSIGFHLRSNISNPNAIGTKIILFSNGKQQIREVKSGESYGVQNSLNLRFGLGNIQMADSIHVIWPSGNQDVYYQIQGDQYYLLIEKECLLIKPNFDLSKDLVMCAADTIDLEATEKVDSVVWNTGAVGPKITISKQGVYFFRYRNEQQCMVSSYPIGLIVEPTEEARLNINFERIICEGDELKLTVPNYHQFIWEDGSTGTERLVHEEGIYYSRVQGLCSELFTDTLLLRKGIVDESTNIPDVKITAPKRVLLDAGLEQTIWWENEISTDTLFIGREFQTPRIESSRSYWYSNFQYTDYQFVHGGLLHPEYVSSPNPSPNLSPGLTFIADGNFILDSVTLFTKRAGERIIELQSISKEILEKRTIFLQEGKNTVYLGFDCKAGGNYILITNIEKNQEQFQSNGPLLERSDKGFSYPIYIQDKCRILTSTLGNRYYYFFYDWVIQPDPHVCSAKRKEVKIELTPTIINNPNEDVEITLSYRDLDNILIVNNPLLEDLELLLYDIHGIPLNQLRANPGISNHEITDLISGVYHVTVYKRNKKIEIKRVLIFR